VRLLPASRRRSPSPNLRDEYANTFYVCRFCNGARHDTPEVDATGRRLLDPCSVAWAEHFRVEEDRLLPIEGDLDAEYTHEIYDLDDPRKREKRRMRASVVRDAIRVLKEAPECTNALRRLEPKSDIDRAEINKAIELLEIQRQHALDDIRRLDPVPSDAPRICRCTGARTLPAHLERQCLEVGAE